MFVKFIPVVLSLVLMAITSCDPIKAYCPARDTMGEVIFDLQGKPVDEVVFVYKNPEKGYRFHARDYLATLKQFGVSLIGAESLGDVALSSSIVELRKNSTVAERTHRDQLVSLLMSQYGAPCNVKNQTAVADFNARTQKLTFLKQQQTQKINALLKAYADSTDKNKSLNDIFGVIKEVSPSTEMKQFGFVKTEEIKKKDKSE